MGDANAEAEGVMDEMSGGRELGPAGPNKEERVDEVLDLEGGRGGNGPC